MRPTPELSDVRLDPPRRSLASIAGRFLLHVLFLFIALGAFLAYQHYSTLGAKTESMVSLLVAGGFALAPVRAVLHAFFAVERRVLHARARPRRPRRRRTRPSAAPFRAGRSSHTPRWRRSR